MGIVPAEANTVAKKGTGMDHPCDCDHPDTSLLRVVLIGEIIRADEALLYTFAEVCEAIGLLQFIGTDESPPPPPPAKRVRAKLRRIK